MKRETLQCIVRFLIKHLTDTEFIHLENIPAHGPVILAINHLSQMDTPVLFVNPRRQDVTAFVTTKYKDNAFVKWFTNAANGIWIDRDIADFTAIHQASEELAKGKVLGIAPEGTRSKSGKLQEGKPGTIMLALKTHTPIVPVALTGTQDALNKLMHFQRPHITATFGEAFTLPEFEPHHRSEELKRWTEILMRKISAMLPEEYRGFYT
jgi:1-acyl-sn-glycerol-3-phosphate acyltransferase